MLCHVHQISNDVEQAMRCQAHELATLMKIEKVPQILSKSLNPKNVSPAAGSSVHFSINFK